MKRKQTENNKDPEEQTDNKEMVGYDSVCFGDLNISSCHYDACQLLNLLIDFIKQPEVKQLILNASNKIRIKPSYIE